jgi:acetyl-CoA carboxylase biotin carboxylase subunit
MESAFAQAQKEALMAFGDGALYVERFLTRVRHVEVQVLGDAQTMLHLGERDCSTQRRNQKLVEESPGAGLPAQLRDDMCKAAARLAASVGYTSAGTIEFIVDEAAGEFYFMEMNTRIQVEHPVTVMVTGVDLVARQIRIAAGEGVGLAQNDVVHVGHAIECRINAEDPENDFAPSPGRITGFIAPGGPGIRVDSHVHEGYTIPPYYDSLIAKVVAWGTDRRQAISRMRRALEEMKVGGVKTTIDFHHAHLDDATFNAGRSYTRYIEQEYLPRRRSARHESGTEKSRE